MTQSEIRKLSNELSSLLKSFAIHLNVDLLRTSKYPSSMALFVQFTLCFVDFATLSLLKKLLKIRVLRLEIRFHFFPI